MSDSVPVTQGQLQCVPHVHGKEGNPMPNDKILKHFDLDAITQPEVREVMRPYHGLAHFLFATIPPGPERSVAMRKLLESSDSAIRAKLFPGG